MPQHRGTDEHAFDAMSAVPIPPHRIRQAIAEKSYRTPAEVRIDVLEIVCRDCRRCYEDLLRTDADGARYLEPCAAATSTEHLRGGPIGTRKRRGALPPEADYRAHRASAV